MIKAKYTVVLKTLLDTPEGKAAIDEALSTYPLYQIKDSTLEIAALIPTREQLNEKILNHYKYREIGFETPGRFIDELKISMDEIMPYYNQLYKSVEIMSHIDDPFGNVDVTETYEEERTDSSTSTATTSGTATNNGSSSSTLNSTDNTETNSNSELNSKHVKSGTPQGMLNITNIDNVNYADEVNWNNDTSNNDTTSNATNNSTSSGTTSETTENESTSNGTATTTGNVKHTFTKKGNQGVNTYAHDMKELRETFLNVTNQIINDERISELFMRVY